MHRRRSGTQRRVRTSTLVKDGPVYRFSLDYELHGRWGVLPIVICPGRWFTARGMKWSL